MQKQGHGEELGHFQNPVNLRDRSSAVPTLGLSHLPSLRPVTSRPGAVPASQTSFHANHRHGPGVRGGHTRKGSGGMQQAPTSTFHPLQTYFLFYRQASITEALP